jgi:Protein of unknown function (DUF3054)
MHRHARFLLLDVLSILAFAAIGRSNHNEGGSISGIVKTAAPFLLALAVGWAGTKAWKRPYEGAVGILVWLVTVVFGMVLRRTVFGRGTAMAFVIVATLFLALTQIGWRFFIFRRVRQFEGSAADA